MDTTGEQPQLKPKQGADEDSLPDFLKDLGLPDSIDSMEEETPEQVLMPAARKKIAMDRQQLLATMVLMGINRLIVTDGSINASVMFELNTKDAVTKSTNRASVYDRTSQYRERDYTNWFHPVVKSDTVSQFKVTTTTANSSTAEVDMHAKLAGKVDVRSRSETFPLERMGELLGVETPKSPAATPAPAPAAAPR